MLEFVTCHGEMTLIRVEHISRITRSKVGTIIRVNDKDIIVTAQYREVCSMLRCAGIPIYNKDIKGEAELDEILDEILPH